MLEAKKLNYYVKWIIETYAQMRAEQASNVMRRVIGYNKTSDKKYEVSIQLIGKSVAFKSNPRELLSDDIMLESFSKKDIKLLTYLACENAKAPTHEILGQKFIRNINKFLFRLKHNKTGIEIEKSAEEISSDPHLIKELSPEDAHKIGYVTANEQFKLEKNIK